MSSAKEKNFKRYIKDYSEEPINGLNGFLYCRICSCKVDYSQKSSVENYLKTSKHVKGKDLINKKRRTQTFFTEENREIYTKIVLAFISADIPLAKLRNDALKNLFNEIKAPLPSESTSRRIVYELIDDYSFKLAMVFVKKTSLS